MTTTIPIIANMYLPAYQWIQPEGNNQARFPLHIGSNTSRFTRGKPGAYNDYTARMALAIENTDRKELATVIVLKGELILGHGCNSLNQLIHSLIASGRRHLVFDVSGIVQLDSTGIGQFIDAYTSLEKVGGKMSIAGVAGPVQEAFRITRLDTVFHFVLSVDAAFVQ